MKLLTLALPVYDGGTCIGFTLQSIIDALLSLSTQEKQMCEILISDNQSVDETSKVINQFISNGLEINYHRNETNIGYDANIDMLVEKAGGKYVWFLGCGEQIKNDALHRLIEKLNINDEYTNILVDFDIYDERKEKITDIRVFNFDKDVLIEAKNNFSHNKYALAVSSNIVNKKKWQQVKKNKLVVDGWCHVERILDMIALENSSKTLLLPHPYFTLLREKNGWWTKPNSYLLLLFHIKIIRSMLDKGYEEKSVEKLEYKQSRVALLMAIVQSKDFGMNLTYKILQDMIELFKYDYFFWLVAFPLLLMPKQLMFIPRSIFKLLQKIKSYSK